VKYSFKGVNLLLFYNIEAIVHPIIKTE